MVGSQLNLQILTIINGKILTNTSKYYAQTINIIFMEAGILLH